MLSTVIFFNCVILNYFIEEGKRFAISNIEIKFNKEINTENIILDDDLIDNLDIKINKIYNKNKIYKSSEKIYNYLQNQGLVFIDVESIEKENDKFGHEEFNDLTKYEFQKLIKNLEKEMKACAKSMEFEKAAMIRDEISEIRKIKIR